MSFLQDYKTSVRADIVFTNYYIFSTMMNLSDGPIKMSNTNIIKFINDKREQPVYNNMKTYI